MSPLLVAWAPYDVKGEELGYSYLGRQACGMCVGVKYRQFGYRHKKFFA